MRFPCKNKHSLQVVNLTWLFEVSKYFVRSSIPNAPSNYKAIYFNE